MIQFNLLPDVKLEYIKTRRTKHLVTLICTVLIIVSLVIFVGLFSVANIFQRKHLSDLNGDIAVNSAKLKAVPDLNKVLTIQNQLSNLTTLHEQAPAASRLFTYLAQLTPSTATISDVKVDFTGKTLTIIGAADKISTVNQYADTLKFTTYTVSGSKTTTPAFTGVVLSSFSVTSTTTNYQLSMSFDPLIFDNTKQVQLATPHIISTRSETEQPRDLFQKAQGGTQ